MNINSPSNNKKSKQPINNNLTEQLYQEFMTLKQSISTNSKKKKNTKRTINKQNNTQQYQQLLHNHNLSNIKTQQEKQFDETKQQQNQFNESRQQQNQFNEKKQMIHNIINTPQPSKKWRNSIYHINNNYSQEDSNDFQQQNSAITNSPNLQSLQKQKQQTYNQKHHLSTNRSLLIDQYTLLYQYSIKKVIQNNNRRIKKKRKRNQNQDQDQEQLKKEKGKYINVLKDNIMNNEGIVHYQQRMTTSDNPQSINQGQQQIARKLLFNYQNDISQYHDDSNHKLTQQPKKISIQTNTFIQNLMNPFQFSINKLLTSHSERLKQIDQNLSKIKLFFHDNSTTKQQLNKKQSVLNNIQKSLFLEQQQQYQNKQVNSINNNRMEQQNMIEIDTENHQTDNKLNNSDNNLHQVLEFNQFNQQYVPDDTSSLYSQTINQHDLIFDDQYQLN